LAEPELLLFLVALKLFVLLFEVAMAANETNNVKTKGCNAE